MSCSMNGEPLTRRSAELSTVEITQKEYLKLIQDSEFLDCLMAAGVDNWDGYESAQEMMI